MEVTFLRHPSVHCINEVSKRNTKHDHIPQSKSLTNSDPGSPQKTLGSDSAALIKTNLCPTIIKVDHFSDGSAKQYKNCNYFYNLSPSEDFFFSCSRNFFAASHGKLQCDGIGGTVKRPVASAIFYIKAAKHLLILSVCRRNS